MKPSSQMFPSSPAAWRTVLRTLKHFATRKRLPRSGWKRRGRLVAPFLRRKVGDSRSPEFKLLARPLRHPAFHFFLSSHVAARCCFETALDGLLYVDVVPDVLVGNVVRKLIESRRMSSFGLAIWGLYSETEPAQLIGSGLKRTPSKPPIPSGFFRVFRSTPATVSRTWR